MKQLCPTGRIFMRFNVSVFFENLSRKLKIHENLARIAGTLHEDMGTYDMSLNSS